jgi:hypothetical protein
MTANECMVRHIVTQDLNIRKVYAKMVPKNLDNQKAGQNEVSAEMLERLETDLDFLTRVMKVGFPNMTLKPRGRVRNGTHHSLQDRRKLT